MDLIKITPDIEKAKNIVKMISLIEERIKLQNKEKMAALIISDYYEIIKELITAILLIDGYKTLSHRDLIGYIKEKYKQEYNVHEIELINNLRILRNRVAYEGFFVDSTYLIRNEQMFASVIEKMKKLIDKKLNLSKLPLSRQQAIKLLKKYNPEDNKHDWNHFIESEAIMKGVAHRLGEDEERWGMLGLLHDVDWGLTKENTKEHLTKAPEILKQAGFDKEFINNIVSHGCGFDCAGLKDKKRSGKVEHALAASETLTGLIHAYALMRGSKISDMEVKGLKKKFKDKKFAEGCNREIIKEIEKTGLELDEFFEIGIESVKDVKEEVGLE